METLDEQIRDHVQRINDAAWELNKKGFQVKLPENIRFTVELNEQTGSREDASSEMQNSTRSESASSERQNSTRSESASSERQNSTRSESASSEMQISEIGERTSIRENGEREVSTGPSSASTKKEEMTEELEYAKD